MKQRYIFIDKCLYFPEKGILVVGDLHLGYESMMKSEGLAFPVNQVSNVIADLKKVFAELKKKKMKVKKVVLLGDIKHYFSFHKPETYDVSEVLDFLESEVKKDNVILIKGNHDTFSLSDRKMVKIHIDEDIAFTHGHKAYPELYDKKINIIVLGHAHPSVSLSEKRGVKKEKFKCFLVGKWKKKEIIFLPSFLEMPYGTDVTDYDAFSIIPTREFKKFVVHIIGDDGRVFKFGKVCDLD